MASDITLISAVELDLRYDRQVLLQRASLAVMAGDRIGLVGRNGSGKSTFLRLLAGAQSPDAGTVTVRRDLVISHLPQEFQLDPALNVRENIRAGAHQILELIHQFESLPADSSRHGELEARIQALDGWGLDHRIETAMAHLNCPDGDRRLAGLSGGELRRVALCRAIVPQPDLLILDEPTNHLDTESVDWLADTLEHFPGAFVLVTHDRHFLDRTANRIVELADGTFWSHAGRYADYLEAKAVRQATAEGVEHRRQMALRRELDWYRTGPRAQRTKSKIRMAAYETASAERAPEVERDVDLVIPPPPPLGNRVADLIQVGMELGGRRLFSGLNLSFAAGRRMGITGRNGLGKTTLLRVLLGQVPPTEGTVRVGQLTRFNYVDQGRLQLNPERTLIDEVGDGTEFVIFGEARLSLRAYLKRFLFSDDRIVTQVKHLSGGERSRLLLARILKNGGNFLILDEPTNDLDLPTLRVVEEALLAYPGVVLVVSHDRYFLNRVCTDILAFEGEGRVTHHVGNYDDYLQWRRQRPVSKAAPEPGAKASNLASGAGSATPKKRKLTFKEQQELAGIEARIETAESEVSRMEAQISDPDFHRRHGAKVAETLAALEAARTGAAGLFARWEELEQIRTGAAAPGG
ncbi:MAG: ABC-F family ATP-binding cassette domain-containing protein [Verrucomicrobia bacterium]|nr:ABC-F family ATP-binding cassette domain-containing protein [Verrucomicrobiota bacterium]